MLIKPTHSQHIKTMQIKWEDRGRGGSGREVAVLRQRTCAARSSPELRRRCADRRSTFESCTDKRQRWEGRERESARGLEARKGVRRSRSEPEKEGGVPAPAPPPPLGFAERVASGGRTNRCGPNTQRCRVRFHERREDEPRVNTNLKALPSSFPDPKPFCSVASRAFAGNEAGGCVMD
jgi:hypothetical protein